MDKKELYKKYGKKRVESVFQARINLYGRGENIKELISFLKQRLKFLKTEHNDSSDIIFLCRQYAKATETSFKGKNIEEHFRSKKIAKKYAFKEYKKFIRSITPLSTQDYKEYLKSKKWKLIREAVIEERGRKCERCSNTKCIQVHHKNYSTLFNENFDDLEVLCDSCHRKEHNLI